MTEKYNLIAETNLETVMTQYTPAMRLSDKFQNEAGLEKEFIRMLQAQGYEYLDIHTEEELIINLRKQLEILNIRNTANRKNAYKINYNLERAKMTDSLRYDVLKRDGFRCCLCGASASDGAVLHVDHIKPVSKGGKTEYNNLQTLCDRCNLGKSNKY